MPHRSPLKPFRLFSSAEMEQGRAFMERIQHRPVGVMLLLVGMGLGYLSMLNCGWGFSFILPPMTNPALTGACGTELGWLQAGRIWSEPWRLVTPLFLHGSLVHLLINGLVFYMFGRVVENLYGTRRLIVLFAVAGLVSSSLSATMRPEATSIGASGAILGLAGVLAGAGLWHRDRIPRLVEDFFRINMWFFIGLLFVMGIALAGLVDNWGHGGGLLAGLALGRMWQPLPGGDWERGPAPDRGLMAGAVPGFAALLLAAAAIHVPAHAFLVQKKEGFRSLYEASELANSGHPERALKRLQQAVDKGQDYVPLHLERAMLAAWTEDWAVAAESQEHVLAGFESGEWSIYVDEPLLLNDLAWYLAMAGGSPESIERAVALADRACKQMDPVPEAFLNTRAYARLLAGDAQGALDDADRALSAADREPANDVYIRVLALWDLGKREEAAIAFEDARRRYPRGMFRAEAEALFASPVDPRRPSQKAPRKAQWMGTETP